METFNSWNGQVVKGRDLKALNLKMIKITREYEREYKVGKNTDKYKLKYTRCSKGGIYFCPYDLLYKKTRCGNGFYYVDVDDDEEIFIETGQCKARTIILSEKILFKELDIDTCKKIIMNNEIVEMKNLNPVCANDVELCKYLINKNVKNYADLPVKMKSNLEICKYALDIDYTVYIFMERFLSDNLELSKLLLSNPKLKKSYIPIYPKFFDDFEFCKLALIHSCSTLTFRHIPEKFRLNEELCEIDERSY
jgi:hypothetical protein